MSFLSFLQDRDYISFVVDFGGCVAFEAAVIRITRGNPQYCARDNNKDWVHICISTSTAKSLITSRPLKKKSGVVAGIAHKSGGRDSPVGYGYAGDNGDVRPRKLAQLSFFPSNISSLLALPIAFFNVHLSTLCFALIFVHLSSSMSIYLL